MKSKEYDTWAEWLKEQEAKTAVKAARRGVSPLVWLALVLLAAVTGLFGMKLFGAPHNTVIVVPEYVRPLCYHNNGTPLPRMGATWIRESGQAVDAVTDEAGCINVPAGEAIGVLNHVTQNVSTVWPGARPICLNIATGVIESGNLCPPG